MKNFHNFIIAGAALLKIREIIVLVRGFPLAALACFHYFCIIEL